MKKELHFCMCGIHSTTFWLINLTLGNRENVPLHFQRTIEDAEDAVFDGGL